MPIYEYECVNNKHRFEVIQKFSDASVDHCTVCGEPVERLISSPAIQFKGSGWYITDYARSGSSDASEKKSTDKPSTESPASTDAKSEKPAPAAPASSTKTEP